MLTADEATCGSHGIIWCVAKLEQYEERNWKEKRCEFLRERLKGEGVSPLFRGTHRSMFSSFWSSICRNKFVVSLGICGAYTTSSLLLFFRPDLLHEVHNRPSFRCEVIAHRGGMTMQEIETVVKKSVCFLFRYHLWRIHQPLEPSLPGGKKSKEERKDDG